MGPFRKRKALGVPVLQVSHFPQLDIQTWQVLVRNVEVQVLPGTMIVYIHTHIYIITICYINKLSTWIAPFIWQLCGIRISWSSELGPVCCMPNWAAESGGIPLKRRGRDATTTAKPPRTLLQIRGPMASSHFQMVHGIWVFGSFCFFTSTKAAESTPTPWKEKSNQHRPHATST